MTEDAADALERHRHGGESFSQFALRIAAILDDADNGTAVTDSNGGDVPDNVLTADHIDDITAQTARKTADELESRLR